MILLLGTLRSTANELIIVSPHWEGIRHEFEKAFQDDYREKTGEEVQVRWRDLGGTSQIERALNASFDANPETAFIDILFGGGLDPYENQKARGQLHPFRLPEEVLKEIPRELHGLTIVDPDFMFYGAALSSFGFLENRKVIEWANLPEVRDWNDLTDPRLFGWVSSTDPRKSGSVHMIYEIILQAYGWEKGWKVIYQMSGNVRSFLQHSSSPTKEVAFGEVAYAVSIDINGMTQQAFLGPENVRFRVPAEVSIINPDGIAILRGAPNLEIAQAFVTFVLSKKGQSLWMRPVGHPDGAEKFGITRMGILPELYEDDLSDLLVPLNPFEQENALNYDQELGSRRWSVLNTLIGQSIIDVHSHLKRAWKAILSLPEEDRPPLLELFSKPLISEEEALMATDFWQTDRVRSGRLANNWMEQAVERFDSIEKKAKALRDANP
ncbi:MAG TPA: extracellular solute-binding protein [Opitutales bacterium]|nr:extracellular solute-binding protein [Opitutales bacterium]